MPCLPCSRTRTENITPRGATGRTDDAAQAETETDYRTKDGDTPELLDRRAYGGGYSKELLKYNELTRAKFNRSGLLIKLPPREVLRGMK